MGRDSNRGPDRSSSGGYVPRHEAGTNKQDSRNGEGSLKKRKGRGLDTVLLIVGIGLLIAAAVILFQTLYPYWQGDKGYDSVAQNATVSDNQAEGLDYSLNVDWASLKEQNPDIVAWIYIPDTEINYPVVQADDNSYYLTHVFDGSENKLGAIFLDYQSASDFSDLNSIIYGHNMRNGSMFHDILDYEDADFYAAHPYVYLATPDGVTHRLKVFAKFVASGSELLDQTAFVDDAEYRAFVQAIFDRNEIETDVTVDQVDHLFMLASCSYEFSDARTLVAAVEVDKYGNPLEIDISGKFAGTKTGSSVNATTVNATAS